MSAYVRQMQARACEIDPHLRFYPLMYYDEVLPSFVNDYREVIDGVVVAYPQDRDGINEAWGILNDAPSPFSAMGFPGATPSKAADFRHGEPAGASRVPRPLYCPLS